MIGSLLVILFFTSHVFAFPVDIVFDIDLTIVSTLYDEEGTDLLRDPSDPKRGTFDITFNSPELSGKIVTETYRRYDGVTDLMQELKRLQKEGLVRISFFSGGHEARNKALLKNIKLHDGSSLYDLATPERIFSRTEMMATGLQPPARIRERFKKDLRIVNPNLEDVVLIDDIKEFVPDSQKGNMFWIDEKFPYRDRIYGNLPVPDAELLYRERNKFDWISNYLFEALERRKKGDKSFSKIIQEMTDNGRITPFSPSEDANFVRGKKALLKAFPCERRALLQIIKK